MMTEDELLEYEDAMVRHGLMDNEDGYKLIAEVRRLNAAYAVCKMMFDPDNQASPFRGVMVWRELVGAFEPEALAKWAKHNRIS